MVLYIRKDLRLSGRCGPLSGANGLDKMFPNALKVIRTMMKDVTRGLVKMIYVDKHVEIFVGGHVGEGPYNAPFQNVRLCSGRGGWTEIVPRVPQCE